MALDPLTQRITRRIAEAFGPKQIYLFGSRVRGDATSLTDYAVSSRYPDVAEPDPSVEEAEPATAASQRVLVFVRARFNG